MRIISGIYRGRPLRAPVGDTTRPTLDRVRESLFASLASLGVLAEATVLDIFAGSGALGLEALSRGAAHVTFVEKSAPVSRLINENIRTLGETNRTTVLARAALSVLEGVPAQSVDLVFADPPYPLDEAAICAVLTALEPALRDEDSLIVLERSARSPEPIVPAGLEVFREKTMGETRLWFLQLRG